MGHSMVHYGKGMPHAHCSICRHYVDPTKADPKAHCTIVRDPIKAEMWCDRFEKKRE
jgi:hypothetical protein